MSAAILARSSGESSAVAAASVRCRGEAGGELPRDSSSSMNSRSSSRIEDDVSEGR